MQEIGWDELKNLLNKSWITHDAMWFRYCLEECGIEATNRINRAAIRSAARIEIKRLARVLGVEKVESFEDLVRLLTGALKILQADFMQFDCEFPEAGVLRWRTKRCFAYEGITRLGVIEQYECGIFERVQGWFDSLNLTYTMSPPVVTCMLHTDGHCYREFRFEFRGHP